MIAYRVYADEHILLDSMTPSYQEATNNGMISGNLSLEINKPGSFDFSLLRSHPNVNDIETMKTTVAVQMFNLDDLGNELDSYWIFVGRVVSIDADMYGNISCQCEGAMAFLDDGIFEYEEGEIQNYSNIGTWMHNVVNSSNLSRYGTGSLSTTFDINRQIYHVYPPNPDYGETDPFTLTKTYDDTDETKYSSYMKCMELIKQSVIDAYGGIFYFLYKLDYFDNAGAPVFKLWCKYYSNHTGWFSYTSPSSAPPLVTDVIDEDVDVPHFTFTTNTLDMSKTPIKTGIWTMLYPVGKDGITIDVDPQDASPPIYQKSISIPAMVSKYGPIIKVVDFSEIETSADLLTEAQNYIDRFMYTDWYEQNNYAIKAVEPCLVSDWTKLVRLGYPAYVQINDTESMILDVLSIKHNLFDAGSSEYVFGPIIPDNVINEDLSSFV